MNPMNAVRRAWFLVVTLLVLAAWPAPAEEFTAARWAKDQALYQHRMSAVPPRYLEAAQLLRAWRTCPDDLLKVCSSGGMNREALIAAANNLYRTAARNLMDDYLIGLVDEPIQAVTVALSTRNFLLADPELLTDFAVANGETAASMRQTIDQGVRRAIDRTCELCAAEFSRLRQEGNPEGAKKLRAEWEAAVRAWKKAGSDLPKGFEEFAEVDPQKTLEQAGAIERDLDAWRTAIEAGDASAAFHLVDRWAAFEREDPRQAARLNFFFRAADGVTTGDRPDWKHTLSVETYARLAGRAQREYRRLLTEGRVRDALATIADWKPVFAGPFGAETARRLGYDPASITTALNTESAKLVRVDPTASGSLIDAFRTDLREFGRALTVFEGGAPVGSMSWYDAGARAGELCAVWTRTTRENPEAAAALESASGIALPGAGDDMLGFLLTRTVNDSSSRFNALQAAGKYGDAQDIIARWQSYLAGHPLIEERVKARYGADYATVLDRLSHGLAAMASDAARLASEVRDLREKEDPPLSYLDILLFE